jgi:hypothetical protein
MMKLQEIKALMKKKTKKEKFSKKINNEIYN